MLVRVMPGRVSPRFARTSALGKTALFALDVTMSEA
jgi:hypothetical protein